MAGNTTTARIKASKRKHGKEHHRGFDEAFALALSQLSSDVGTGSYSVRVEFAADVEVTNPGTVGFYRVTLSTP
ncbi:MAG TPA: hypothetical protein VE088_08490 [Gaiellaceae bacterium]|jgi:hypothetical protein|nr:hypothetical protein [Gaiellaceae bacterium]